MPYVGAGGGVDALRVQAGAATSSTSPPTIPRQGTFTIFTDTFKSEGWAPSAHAFGGADIQVFKRLYLSLEGRYTWVNADLDQDFIDFEPMDLGGFRFGAGINFVF